MLGTYLDGGDLLPRLIPRLLTVRSEVVPIVARTCFPRGSRVFIAKVLTPLASPAHNG